MQIALDLEFDARRLPRQDGLAQVVSNLLVNAKGQVALHPSAIRPTELSLQIQHARKETRF